jgi:hypothetical protein
MEIRTSVSTMDIKMVRDGVGDELALDTLTLMKENQYLSMYSWDAT